MANRVSPLLAISDSYFLSSDVDVSSLPVAFRDHRGQAYVRISAEAISDVISFHALWPDLDMDSPPCEPMIHERFDRYELAIMEITPGSEIISESYQPRFLRDESGRRILQDTNTTAADFILAPQTPGTIPP